MPEQTLMPGTNWQVWSNTAQRRRLFIQCSKKGQTDIITDDSAFVDDASAAGIT
jgi:hypothetical protein